MALEKNPIASISRIALTVEYDGASYSGWQKQRAPVRCTVQQQLETALSKIADQQITLTCAGRTDAGVHATNQIVHFDCAIDRGRKAWVIGSNSLLPSTIRVLEAQRVPRDFHARFSAVARRYNYVILVREAPPAILVNRVTTIRATLDIAAMAKAASYFIGEQDFSAFRAAGCQSKTAMRNVHNISLSQCGPFMVLDIEANAFLQHMVRNITGSLLEIGLGNQSPEWIKNLLESRDRTLAAKTAPPHGLYLAGVSYPENFAMKHVFSRPLFLPTSI